MLLTMFMATKDVHLLNFIFLLLFPFMWTCRSIGQPQNWLPSDTLRPGGMLNSSTSLVSANGMFTLRFDNIYESSYLVIRGIITTSSADFVIVWIANSRSPIVKDSGVLNLDSNNNTVATLSDSGNFILKEVDSDGSTKRVLWQSFDYPLGMLLPGMKLGVSHKTGQTWSLSSWLTAGIPAPGPFTLEWDPKGGYLVIRRRGVIYWKGDPERLRNIVSRNETKTTFEFRIVSNEEEEYFTYINVNQSQLSYWMLSSVGQFHDLKGHNFADVDNCYGYNIDGGCQRWEQPICRENGDHIFDRRYGYFLAEISPTTTDFNTNLSISDCRAICWSNCDCVAYRSAPTPNRTGCLFWTGNSEFIPVKSNDDEPTFILSSRHSHNGTKNLIWIFTIIGIAGLLFLCYSINWRKVVLEGEDSTKIENELLRLISDRSTDGNDLQNDGKKVHNFKVYSYACIMASTNNFSLENKLGQGGFGLVYKGKLPKGQEKAVKRLSRSSRQGIQEFKNELVLISELQHMNLVQLLGCCIHREERMLLYEYMPNKSLDYFLFDSTRSRLLDWNNRFKIIEGIAQGLLYLHKYSRVRVIHRDLKASNVLLDERMNPKISDFGMARIFKENELEANTSRVVGTYGYMSPEYAMVGVFSIKSDVYSFGVLMVEILSGRKINRFYYADHQMNLLQYAWDLWQGGKGLELMDPAVSDSCAKDQMLTCIQVALLCVEDSVANRPTMSDVLSMITNEIMPLPMPEKPTFSIGKKVEANVPDEEPKFYSANGLSITDMDAR